MDCVPAGLTVFFVIFSLSWTDIIYDGLEKLSETPSQVEQRAASSATPEGIRTNLQSFRMVLPMSC